MKYKAILFSPDGDFQTDCFADTVEQVWELTNDLGSKWIFYPIIFVIKDKGGVSNYQEIIDVCMDFDFGLKGKSIKTVRKFLIKNNQEIINYLRR